MASPSSEAPTGLLLVISSPSGAGKTTLSRRLVRSHPELRFSVSYTTRPPRAGEVDGVDYHFVSDEEFQAMAARGEFAEWALVYGRRYGTATRTVRQALDRHEQVLFDVDVQGAASLMRQFPREARLLFILPPSLGVLEHRLRSRATDALDVIERRLQKAREELAQAGRYDYVVLNDDLERAYAEVEAVYLTERARSLQQTPPGMVVDAARACSRERQAGLLASLF